MADSFFRWPPNMKYSKKSLIMSLRQIFLFLLPIVSFLTIMYLIFQKLQKPPLSQIAEHLSRKEFKKALELAEQELQKNGPNYVHYLMMATVAAEGIAQGKEVANYEAKLQIVDQSGIYLKESYLKRFSYFSQLPNFPGLFMKYLDNFKIDPNTDSYTLQLIEKHLEQELAWNPIDTKKGYEFFQYLADIFPERVLTVNADNLQLRREPSLESKVIQRLSFGQKVLRRLRGPEMVIAGRRDNWLYVFTEQQLSGWVFGGYLK